MNKNLRNRFKLEVKNQFLIKLLLTAVLIYSSNQKVAGLDSGFMSPILSDVITDEASTNLLLSKEYADYKSVKLETSKMTPPALLDVSVSIVSNATNNSICRGTAVTFTATPTNGGSSPTYLWKINGVNSGTGSALTSNNVLNNDVITVVMTTSLSSASVNNTTATSNAITLIVYNPLVLSTNQATISSCTGAGSATINAVSSNGSVIDWYANTASTTTPYLTSSNSYTTPSISTSKIYYAVARDTVKGCLSAKQSANNIALSFDGVDDKVTSNITTFTSTSELTYETWVYANNFGGFNSFRAIANHIGFTTGMVHFQFNGNKLRFDVSGFNNTGCTYTFSPNTWYHVAAVYSATQKTLKYYVNGILETTFVNTSLVNIVGNSPFTIGSWDNSRFLSGRLDEFRIWNVARTQSEIQANMCEEIDQQAGLVASYHFNDGVVGGNNNSITTVIDASGNSNNGTLVNFAKTGSSSNYATGNGSINRTPIAVTLNPLPTVMSSTSGVVLCGGSSTTISATASDGAIIDWYAASTGGTAIATAIGTFTTPAISATTTYYAEARDTIANCVSASRTSVTATVNSATTAGITNNTGSTELTCIRTAVS